MTRRARWTLRAAAAAAILTLIAASAMLLTGITPLEHPALAQESGDVPSAALGIDSDSDFWRAIRGGVQGSVSIPDEKAGILVQSSGEGWRSARNGPLSTYGAWLLLATVVILAVFFVLRGRIRIEAGRSNVRITRFGPI